jgi:hypothetical protein
MIAIESQAQYANTMTSRTERRAVRHPLRICRLAAAVAVMCVVSAAHADARRFTFVYEAPTLPKGVIEYEQWVTLKTHKEIDSNFTRLDFRHEFEFGITDDFQLAFYASDWQYQTGSSVDDGFDWNNVAVEAIYNILDPVTEPVGLSLYGETKIGDELFALEGKLIAQLNYGKWIWSWNGIIEAEWEGSDFDEDKGELGQTFGGSYQFTPALIAGFELLHEVEYEDWSEWSDHAFYAGPNFGYRTTSWWITITGLAQLTNVDVESDFQLRLIFGFDF